MNVKRIYFSHPTVPPNFCTSTQVQGGRTVRAVPSPPRWFISSTTSVNTWECVREALRLEGLLCPCSCAAPGSFSEVAVSWNNHTLYFFFYLGSLRDNEKSWEIFSVAEKKLEVCWGTVLSDRCAPPPLTSPLVNVKYTFFLYNWKTKSKKKCF